jgi:hypothetical protein
MTQSDYVRHSGLTKGRVSQLVKAGMPLDSPEAADGWRGMSAQKRSSIIPKSVSGSSTDPGPYRPPEARAPTDSTTVTADTPQGAYERQRQIEREAYKLTVRALEKGQSDAGRLVSIHAQAARNLTQAREEVLTLSERERTLVSGDWVRRVMQEHDGAVASLLKSMPKQLAGRIAPHDPEHAERELTRWVQEVALKTLHNTDPWKS